jgi:hypothetical protein
MMIDILVVVGLLTTDHHQGTQDHTHHLQETQEQTRMSRPHEAVIKRNLLAQEQAYLANRNKLA